MSGLLTDTQRDLIALASLTPILVHLLRLLRTLLGRRRDRSVLSMLTIDTRVRPVLLAYNRESNGDISVLKWLFLAAVGWTLLGAFIGAVASPLLNLYAGMSTLLVAAQYFALVYIYWGFDAWYKSTVPAALYRRFVALMSTAWILIGILAFVFLRSAQYTFDTGPSKVGLAMQCIFALLASFVVAARDTGRAILAQCRRVTHV